MGEDITEDPLDITKQQVVIKEAQKDVAKLDILVCGQCHEVFHFIEQFMEHRSSPNRCPKKSDLARACEAQSQSQVWAFILWKQKQLRIKNDGESTYPSSWSIYQRWTKLSPADREIWVTAGNFIQWQDKVSTAKVVEAKSIKSPVREPPVLEDMSKAEETKAEAPKNVTRVEEKKPQIEKDEPAKNIATITNDKSAIRSASATNEQFVVERILAKRFTPKRKTWEYKIKWENFPEEESTWEPLANLESCKALVNEFEENLRKLKIEKAKQSAAAASSPPRGRGRPRISTSPSPSLVSNSSTEKASVSRPQRICKQKALNQVKQWCGNISDGEGIGGIKRPYEGDSSDDSVEKRIKLEAESDDTDDDYEQKRVHKKTPKQTVVKNGLGVGSKLPDNILIPDAKGVVRINQKQLPALSSGVYIMSKTAGIIKLDSATSKIATSGGQAIVKVAPKIGQTHIKIVKKDGATTSKVIPTTKSSPVVKQALKQVKTPKPVTNVAKIKKVLVPDKPKTPITDKTKQEAATPAMPEEEASDSDYGLEELEFPTEIKVPEPDSEAEGDFVLDPITGKIAGQEYPDPLPEPEPETLPEEADIVMKTDLESSTVAENSLDNLVKLAAADITEDDLHPLPAAPSNIEEPVIDEHAIDTAAPTTETQSLESKPEDSAENENDNDSDGVILVSETKPTATVESTKPVVTVTTKESLVRTNILQQTLQTSVTPRPRIQQRVLNQTVASRPSQLTTVVRSVQAPRKVIAPPKPKFQISSSQSPLAQYQNSSITRRIGQTTIYKSQNAPGIRKEPIMKQQQMKRVVYQTSPSSYKNPVTYKTAPSSYKTFKSSPTFKTSPTTYKASPTFKSTPTFKPSSKFKTRQPVYKTTPKKEAPVILNSTVSPIKPKPVISMPSLTAEEEPVVENVQTATTSAEETTTLTETDLSSFTLANNESPIFLTGDDGTVYQVAGQDEQGQTILITQGADGQQQCLLVTSESAAEEVQQQAEPTTSVPVTTTASVSSIQTESEEPLSIKTDDVPQDQVVAQVVRTEPPSPGGTHKVVVMLPDGNLMVTKVTPEEYASLELDK